MGIRYVVIMLVATLTSGLGAQSVAPGAVSIKDASGLLELRITGRMALSDVINSFCQKTNTQCEGVNSATGIAIAPMLIRARWSEVVARLLEGTRLDYVAIQPSATGAQGMLLIQSRQPESARSPVASAAAPIEQTSTNSDPNFATPPDAAIQQPEKISSDEQGSDVMAAAATNSVTQTQGALLSGTSGTAGSPLTSNVESGDQVQAAVLPFPDSHGNPIPINNEPPQYLPFPDSHGRPIPVSTDAPQGSPFPVDAIRQANRQNPHQ